MNLGKRIAAAVIAAATALTALSVSAFAADPIGTNPTRLKEGVEATELIPYDKGENYDNGKNYCDFIYTAPDDGYINITLDAAIDCLQTEVYKASDFSNVKHATEIISVGSNSSIKSEGVGLHWSSNAGMFSGVRVYPVEKGDYIIRVRRVMGNWFGMDYWGRKGNGRIHITVEMRTPEAPADIKIQDKTDSSVKFSWREPGETGNPWDIAATSYDLRYKAGNGDWTTVKDIMDNNVTIKKLKGATKYTYQMRSHAGEIVGDWSKAASFKTTDPKNVKFDTPKINASIAVHITWKSVKNATGYKVQYSTDQKNWKTLTVEEPAADIPVVSGKTYYYKVAAKNSSKTGSFSKVSSIKIG